MKMPASAVFLVLGLVLATLSGCRGSASGGTGGSRDESQAAPEAPQPLLALDADDYLVAVTTADILPEYQDERLVAKKRKSVPDSPVTVSLEGYDARRRKAVKLWDSVTKATGFRGFTMTLMDLVGDHSMEIVCRGVNGSGQRTLDVFRKSYAPKSKGPAYTSVCEIMAEEIRIEKVERPEGYQTGQKNGPSFPLVAYAADRESRNPMDLVRTTYSWKYAETRYVAGPPEKVSAEKVEQRQLEELFAENTVEGFERFLEGTWKKPSERTITKSDSADPAILFQPSGKTIAFYSADSVEIYEWLESRRTLYNGLLVIAENRSNAAASIRKILSIFVRTPSSIEVSIQGADQYDNSDGTYARTSTMDAGKGIEIHPTSTLERSGFQGTFLGEKGLRIVFSGDRAVVSDGKKTQSALCTVFLLADRRILSLRILSENGLSKDQRDYLIEERDRGGSGRSARSLVLVPVTLTSRGYEEMAGDTLSEDPAALSER